MDEDVARLLSHISTSVAPTCAPAEDYAPPGAIASVRCASSGAPGGGYVLFLTKRAMDAEYRLTLDAFRDEVTGNDCSLGPSRGTYSVMREPAGKFICFESAAKGMIVWTDDRFNILGYASLENTATGPDWKRLHRWWRRAGRLVGGDQP